MIVPSDRRLRLLGLAVVLVAALLTLAGVPVTSAQGTTLFVANASGTLPVGDPYDPSWDALPGVDVPLSGQAVTPPMLIKPSVPRVRVRAQTDDDRLAVLIEWQDPTQNDSVLRVDRFADAVAMQIAMGEGISICMGQKAGALNIWHWKADWAADAIAWRDVQDVNPNMPMDASLPHIVPPGASPPPGPPGFFTGRDAGNARSQVDRPSMVEDLNAVGFGTLTPQPRDGQEVSGAAAWRNGTWRVVLSRTLSDGDPNDATLGRDRALTIAFAVWDGDHGDRDGQKSVSSWLSLAFTHRGPVFVDAWFVALILLALGLSGGVIWFGSRQRAVGLGWPPGGPQGGGDVGGPG